MRGLAPAVGILALAVPALCQNGAAQPRQATTVEGRVVDSSTGAALGQKKVTIATPEGSRHTTTDQAGRYSFSGEFSGLCRVSVPRDGEYFAAAAAVVLTAGQTVRQLDLKMDRGAMISGRVIGAGKTPIADARVVMRETGYKDGRPWLLGIVGARTNDIGEYSMRMMPAGRYIVSVSPRDIEFHERPSAQQLEGADPAPVSADSLTYYGNTISADSSMRLNVRTGEVNEHVDFAVIRTNGVCVSTTISTPPDWSPGTWIGVTMSESLPGRDNRIAWGRFRKAGEVEACGVTPGSYQLFAASTTAAGESLFAVQSVVVTGSAAVRSPAMHLQRLAPVRGRITVSRPEDRSSDELKKPLPPMGITLQPRYRATWAVEKLTAKIGDSGEFEIPGTMPDDYWITLQNLPEGYYVKGVEVSGRDVYAAGFRAGSGVLEVTLGVAGPTVSGIVVDRENQPQAGVTVMLVASAGTSELPPGQVQTASSDETGRFVFRGMPPNAYHVAALRGVRVVTAGSPEVVQAVRQAWPRIELSAGEQKTIQVEARQVTAP